MKALLSVLVAVCATALVMVIITLLSIAFYQGLMVVLPDEAAKGIRVVFGALSLIAAMVGYVFSGDES